MNILTVAAHPDDEILGCGATMARLTGEGHQIFISIHGEGITSRFDQRETADAAQLQALHQRSHEAARLVGAKDLFLHGLPDNRFDSVDLLDIVKQVEKLIHQLSPEIIFTHHAGDLNLDHVLLHRAVMIATRPMAGHPVREVYTFEIPSSSEWAFGQFKPAFCPNVFYDAASTIETKIQAMQAYESEARPFPHPRSPQALRALGERWGSAVGLPSAEAFELVRSLR